MLWITEYARFRWPSMAVLNLLRRRLRGVRRSDCQGWPVLGTAAGRPKLNKRPLQRRHTTIHDPCSRPTTPSSAADRPPSFDSSQSRSFPLEPLVGSWLFFLCLPPLLLYSDTLCLSLPYSTGARTLCLPCVRPCCRVSYIISALASLLSILKKSHDLHFYRS